MSKSHGEELLSVHNLQIGFHSETAQRYAVDGVDLTLSRGKTLALLGESGCGKTLTALSVLQLLPNAAHITPSSEISLENRNLLKLPEIKLRNVRGQRIGMIFQEPMTSLNPVLTIGEQIREVLNAHFSLTSNEIHRRLVEVLKAVGLPDPEQRLKQYPHQLSGGMKQRVMIAMALAGEPDLLIADEPTTALDVTIQAQILDLLQSIQAKTGMAILLITHDLGVVKQVADEVAVMYAGHIVEQASAAELFSNPLHPYTKKLFAALPNLHKRQQALSILPGQVPSLAHQFRACRFVDRCPSAFQACHEIAPLWVAMDAHHSVRCHLYKKPADAKAVEPIPDNIIPFSANTQHDAKPVLSVKQLKVHFPIQKGLLKRVVGHVRAVDDISFNLYAGKTLALVGESGCGKTTAGRGILQLIPTTDGQVYYHEDDLTAMSARQLHQHRSDLQIIFQDPYSSMNPRMMVGDIIAEGLKALGGKQSQATRQQAVETLLKQVGLPVESQYRYPHEFSGGQRQRICIARALAVKPKVIICDEPTSALDVSVQAQILNLLKELQDKLGIAFLFITHDISVVAYLADEIAVMYLGRIVEHGPAVEILKSPKHPYTQALLSAVPIVDNQQAVKVIKLKGEQPSPISPPSGCYFHPRCPHAMEQCKANYPTTRQVGENHVTNCYLY